MFNECLACCHIGIAAQGLAGGSPWTVVGCPLGLCGSYLGGGMAPASCGMKLRGCRLSIEAARVMFPPSTKHLNRTRHPLLHSISLPTPCLPSDLPFAVRAGKEGGYQICSFPFSLKLQPKLFSPLHVHPQIGPSSIHSYTLHAAPDVPLFPRRLLLPSHLGKEGTTRTSAHNTPPSPLSADVVTSSIPDCPFLPRA